MSISLIYICKIIKLLFLYHKETINSISLKDLKEKLSTKNFIDYKLN